MIDIENLTNYYITDYIYTKLKMVEMDMPDIIEAIQLFDYCELIDSNNTEDLTKMGSVLQYYIDFNLYEFCKHSQECFINNLNRCIIKLEQLEDCIYDIPIEYRNATIIEKLSIISDVKDVIINILNII